ncbi:hypothetical protein GCM10007874_31320 [Labrys miyagiensis]|uniref:Uncharacterized protein n=1 Tax=Labrys miyagiensis TaxID=346912 RepID=A0ABQ6CJP4_9HYPH|nr:hypothetical protein [Labrys miyagiensis]GLS20115.1 hypothetical protein GCM10007874_31320 [Labrys miyagiensis]
MADDGKRKLNFKKSRDPLELDLDELTKLGNDAAVKAGMVPREYAERVAPTISEPVNVEAPAVVLAATGDAPAAVPALHSPVAPMRAPAPMRRDRQQGAGSVSDATIERDRVTAELPRNMVAEMKHAVVADRSTIREFLERAIAKELAARARA